MNFKARDDSALSRFWSDALGWGMSSEGSGVTKVEPLGLVLPDPAAVYVDVASVPDPETVRYRAHLDLATTSTSTSTPDATSVRPCSRCDGLNMGGDACDARTVDHGADREFSVT